MSPAGIGPGQHQARTASRGPLGWPGLSLAALVGGAFVFYFRKEKERLTQRDCGRYCCQLLSGWCAERMGRTDSHGNPLLGGPFELFDGVSVAEPCRCCVCSHQPTVHIPQPSVHIPQPSVHLPQPSVHIPQPSVHLPQSSVHLPQPSVPIRQSSVHLPQSSSA